MPILNTALQKTKPPLVISYHQAPPQPLAQPQPPSKQPPPPPGMYVLSTGLGLSRPVVSKLSMNNATSLRNARPSILSITCTHETANTQYYYYTTRFSLPRGEVHLQTSCSEDCTILPLVGHARSKQDPINRGHGAQYLYRPPAAGANIAKLKTPSSV